ncbi:hypothetical protein FOL47_005529 [Perkinsus chesapeaki]|uniref:C2H2-type domain-containing protein n=1 Tax=Perkinsus chesapeaki TaxID=330153 RepID=A0A7J6LYD9_PERCH|nr:hypothetical protein FOL47_005529 [Perkinsus chesapeaki]
MSSNTGSDKAVREAAVALRQLLDAPRWKPSTPLTLPWGNKSLGRIHDGVDTVTGSSVPNNYTNRMIVTEELVSLHMKRGQFREAIEYLDERTDKKILTRDTLPPEYRANMLVNLLHCELEAGRIAEALDSSEDAEKRIFPADKELEEAVLANPAWHLLNARTYFYYFAWDMALAECKLSNSKERNNTTPVLQGQLHTWRDIIYSWCMGQKRLASGTMGDVIQVLESWQRAVDEEEIRVQEKARFSRCWYLRFILMALSNIGYCNQSEEGRVEIHRLLLERCQQLLRDLSHNARTRGDPLLRRARKILRVHRKEKEQGEGGVDNDDIIIPKQSILYIDATHCGTLGRWIKHNNKDPNVEFYTYYTQPGGMSIPSVAIRACKAIKAGDIITADYGTEYQIPEMALRKEDSPEVIPEDKFYLDDNGDLRATNDTTDAAVAGWGGSIMFNIHGSSSFSSSSSSSSTPRMKHHHHPWRYGDVNDIDNNNSDEYIRRLLGDTLGNVATSSMGNTSSSTSSQGTTTFRRVVNNAATAAGVADRVHNTSWLSSRRRRNDDSENESGDISDDERDGIIKGRRRREKKIPPSPVKIPTTTTSQQCGGNNNREQEEKEDEDEEPYKVTDPVVLGDSHWTMLEGGFKCKLCDATVVHESQLRGHIEGRRHKKNLSYKLWEQSQCSSNSCSTTGIPTPKQQQQQQLTVTTTTKVVSDTTTAPPRVIMKQANNNGDRGSKWEIQGGDASATSSVAAGAEVEPVAAFAWFDDYERKDYENQCNRQFWADNGELRTDGIVDILGIQHDDDTTTTTSIAPAHCVYEAMYCSLCGAKPDGWWKWTQHFKGKKHMKHVYSTRATHIAYWQKLSAGTGPFQPANNTTSRVLLNDTTRHQQQQQQQSEGTSTWEEHPCELCKCVLYSMEELRNHLAGKRHQKALRNKEWYKAQEDKQGMRMRMMPLTTVEENEVLLTTITSSLVVGRSDVDKEQCDNDSYTPASAIMLQYPTEWEVISTGFKCTICGCNVNSEGSMDMHLRGSGHRKKKENIKWQQQHATTTTTTAAAIVEDSVTAAAASTSGPQATAAAGDGGDEIWDMSRVPEWEQQFIKWDDNRGYVCSCCGNNAACCTIDILLMHLKGKKHTSKSKWYKTGAAAASYGNGGEQFATAPMMAGNHPRDSITTTGGGAIRSTMLNGSIFEDRSVWEETQYGWRCKLCDASVNAEPMAMAHASSRKHQNNLLWGATSSSAPSNNFTSSITPAVGMVYHNDEQFEEQCTHQFYGTGDIALQCGYIGDDRAPAHNDWNDSRCKLCQTGDICGWGAWHSHFTGKVHKKNVRSNRYEYDAIWQRFNAEGFEYYYDHLTGLWDSTIPIESDLGEAVFRQDGILYFHDISTTSEDA